MASIPDINRRISKKEIVFWMTSPTIQILIKNKFKISKSSKILNKTGKREVSILTINIKDIGKTMRLKLTTFSKIKK